MTYSSIHRPSQLLTLLPIHSSIYPLNIHHPFICPLIHPPSLSFTYSSTHPFHPSIYPVIYIPNHLPIHPYATTPSIQPTHSSIHLSTHLSTHAFIYLLPVGCWKDVATIHPPICLLIHPSIRPSNHPTIQPLTTYWVLIQVLQIKPKRVIKHIPFTEIPSVFCGGHKTSTCEIITVVLLLTYLSYTLGKNHITTLGNT